MPKLNLSQKETPKDARTVSKTDEKKGGNTNTRPQNEKKSTYRPSILRIDGKNNFIEVKDNGFYLPQINSAGNLKNLQCKVQLNFAEYNDKYEQTAFIPFYFDSLEWKGLLEDLRSGIFDRKASDYNNSKERFPAPMYSFMKGTTASDGNTYARVLEIRPAKKPYHFLISCTGGEGVTSPQGTVTFKKGCKQQKIAVLVSHTLLGGMLADVASRIPATPIQ